MIDERGSPPILIAGFGSAGRRHFRNLRRLGRENFVFLRSGKGILDDAEISEFPFAGTMTEALAYHPEIVIIATPSAMHLEIAQAAAEAGCNLFIEKPLGHELHGLDQLLAVAQDKKLIVMVGCQFRFHPLFMELRSMIEGGMMGRIVGAAAEYGDYLPAWHPWEDHRQSYSARLDLGGGAILTLIHPMDYLYSLFGKWRRIQAMTARVPCLGTPAGEDWCDINVEFENGVLAHIHVDYIQWPATHRLNIVGELGRVICDFNAGEMKWRSVEGDTRLSKVPSGFERNTMFLDELKHFLSCVSDRTQPQVSLADGIAALKMALEARSVASLGREHG